MIINLWSRDLNLCSNSTQGGEERKNARSSEIYLNNFSFRRNEKFYHKISSASCNGRRGAGWQSLNFFSRTCQEKKTFSRKKRSCKGIAMKKSRAPADHNESDVYFSFWHVSNCSRLGKCWLEWQELSDMIAGRFVCISANLVLRLNELRIVFDLVVFGQQLFGETEVHLGLGRVLFLQCDYASVRVIDELVRPGNSAP